MAFRHSMFANGVISPDFPVQQMTPPVFDPKKSLLPSPDWIPGEFAPRQIIIDAANLMHAVAEVIPKKPVVSDKSKKVEVALDAKALALIIRWFLSNNFNAMAICTKTHASSATNRHIFRMLQGEGLLRYSSHYSYDDLLAINLATKVKGALLSRDKYTAEMEGPLSSAQQDSVHDLLIKPIFHQLPEHQHNTVCEEGFQITHFSVELEDKRGDLLKRLYIRKNQRGWKICESMRVHDISPARRSLLIAMLDRSLTETTNIDRPFRFQSKKANRGQIRAQRTTTRTDANSDSLSDIEQW